MKKILFITAFTPSRFSAGQNYTFNLLEDISRTCQVDLVYGEYQGQVYEPAGANVTVVKVLGLSWLDRLLSFIQFPFFHPLFSSRFQYKTAWMLQRRIKTQHYDAIYIDFSQVFIYSLFLDHPNKILMAHDVIIQKFRRDSNFFIRRWVQWTEKLLLRNGLLLVFSAKDKQLIRDTYGQEAQVVNFYLSPRILALREEAIPPGGYFCFFAAWNRPENSEGLWWFLKEVLPQVTDRRFVIIGFGMPGDLLEALRTRENVEYLGFMEDPYSVIAKADALIAPLFKGAGVKVKVIEALACGTFVFGTTVALEGVPHPNSGGVRVCHVAADFVREIKDLRVTAEDKMNLKRDFLNLYEKRRKTIAW